MLTIDEDRKKTAKHKNFTRAQLEGVESEWLEWAAWHTARK